jgi:hypothetical protein
MLSDISYLDIYSKRDSLFIYFGKVSDVNKIFLSFSVCCVCLCCRKYLRGWFGVDFVSGFPVDALLYIIAAIRARCVDYIHIYVYIYAYVLYIYIYIIYIYVCMYIYIYTPKGA